MKKSISKSARVGMLHKQPSVHSTLAAKKELAELDNSLHKILGLRPVTWKWKDEEDGTDLEFGFIAQEVEKVIPHLVSNGTWRDGTTKKFINMGNLIPYLVCAIKEQQEQIEELQNAILKLKK